MLNKKTIFAIISCLVLLALLAAPLPAAASPTSADFLNPDGTLRMERLTNGALDLRGWDVQLDPRRGPVFRPAVLNGAWSALGSGVNDIVLTIAISGANVYVGGQFTSAGGSPANRIAVWDGANWSALGSGMNGAVDAIAVSGANVYAGGAFSSAGDSPANNIAVWNGTNWSALGSGVNSQVFAIAVSGANVYVGGSFTSAGGSSANHIAVWNGAWSALGSGVDGVVFAIAVSGANVYVGGSFTNPANHIAVWNGAWSALGSGVNGFVIAIAVSGANVYAGGAFTSAGGSPASYIAVWDGANWSALGNGVDSLVRGIAISGANVYVGGQFTSAGGSPANRIAGWDGANWSALGGGLNSSIFAIAPSGSNVYAGGNFTDAGGNPNADHIASFQIDSVAPTVVFGSGSVPPSDGATLTTTPSQLVVQFSESVRSGGADGSAEYGGNYLLLRAGPNGAFDTTVSSSAICDADHVGIAGDDVWIRIDTLAYNGTNYSVTVTIDPASAPLANGTYRLYVCGAASIDDLDGNPLNGGSNSAVNFTVGTVSGAGTASGTGTGKSKASKLPSTGFPLGRVANLPIQPAEKAYSGTDLVLEIPALNQKMTIVGVPQSEQSWDVSWLGKSAGWLEGSAYPTWSGNSVLTGHVWDADNHPGPFVNLKTLKYGDRVLVHAFGHTYTYEVRESSLLDGNQNVNTVFKHHDEAWLTLLTCEAYNPLTGGYFSRRMVGAVLVSIK